MLAPCFANMKEIKRQMLKNIPQTLYRHVQHLFGGARSLCVYHSWFQTGQSLCIYMPFTVEAIEVIPSLVGNETAILLSFKPHIQHKSQIKRHKHTHKKCQLTVVQQHTLFPKTILYLEQNPESIIKTFLAWLLLLCLLLLAIFTS